MPTTKRVLVVDDSEATCEMLVDALNDNGYEAVSVNSADDAYEIVEGFKPDVVLLDINMPAIDGIDLFMLLRSYSPVGTKTPVIFVSALEARVMERKVKELGASGYIEKPFRLDEITNALDKVLH
jgi:DNA-binding response OmpR family regulator